MVIWCPECGSENDAARRFCNACGRSVELLCAGCGFSNRVGDRYCGGCGVTLAAVAPPPPPVAAEPAGEEAWRDELRRITVMMADLDGFAEMTDRHGRERQTEVMNTVFQRLAEKHIVRDFDGYIDKFLDGDIMALFGAPTAHEDAPERAARAAVRMHEELARLHAEGIIPADTPLRLRIGLNTGPVRVGGVGAGGRMEYTAMGDTVNLAARLMTACEWGSTLISVNTHKRIAASFELTQLPPVKVKGKSEPVPIWSVDAERRRAARVELAAAEGMSRLVGRTEQTAALDEAFALAEAGRGQVVGIRGEAGIGKSRLVYELHQRVRERVRYLEGRCLSYGLELPFLPFKDLLASLFEFDDRDADDIRRGKLRAGLTDLAVDLEATLSPLEWLLLGEATDRQFAQLDPQELRQRLDEAVCALLAALARDRPVLLFLDDLQWLDADSRALLDLLIDRAAEQRLLVALAFRPDYAHDLDRWPHYRLVEPRRLSLEESREVVHGLLAARGFIDDETPIDATLAEAAYHKSQGNPFFLDQTITALLERAEQTGQPTIDFRRGRLLISEAELGDLVPDSVEEILLARIDKLPEKPRSLLQAASVAMIGRYFRRSALAWCVGGDDLDSLLATLESRELIRRETAGDDDAAYVFEHALARDVAYNNLLRAERRRLHTKVGAYIEEFYAQSLTAYLDDLSYHYYYSTDAVKALRYLPQSAERAARSYSNTVAALNYKRALEKAEALGRDGGIEDRELNLGRVRLEVLKGLTAVQALTGDRESLDYGQQRLDLARELGDRDAIFDASYMLAHQYTALGQFDQAQRYFREVRAEYEAIEAWDGVRDSEVGIGNMYYLQGRYAEALEHFQKALDVQVERLEFEPFGLWIAHNNLAAAYDALGRFEDLLAECAVCEDLLEKLPEDDPMRLRLQGYTSGNLGSAHRNLGNLEAATEAYERTLKICEQTGEKQVEAEVRHWLGRTLLARGRLKLARRHLDEALALARESGAARWEVGAQVALAEADLLDDDPAAAGARLTAARTVLEQTGELGGGGELALVEARLRRLEGRPDEAARRLTEYLDAAAPPSEVDRAPALVELALAELALGHRPAAADCLTRALELCDARLLKPTRTRALSALARVLWPAEPAGAEAAVNEALAVAEAMDALEDRLTALGLRALVRAATDPPAARADLATAEALLEPAAATAGETYVAAARRRHLIPARMALETP